MAEAGGRAVTASRQVDVDPVPFYLGVRPAASSARPGVPASFSLALVSPDGKGTAEDAEVEVELLRETWNTSLVHEDGRYRYQSTRLLEPAGDPLHVAVRGGKAVCQVTPTVGGSYVLAAASRASAS